MKWLFQCGSLAHGWMCKANASTFRARWGIFNEPPTAWFWLELPKISLVNHLCSDFSVVKWLFQCGSLTHGWMCKANSSTFRARWGLSNEPPMALFGPKLPELSLVRHYAVILVWWNGCSSVVHLDMDGCKQLMAHFLELVKGFQMSHQCLILTWIAKVITG